VSPIDATVIRSGLILPQSILQSDLFAIFAAFVAINTVIYVVLALLKILPRPHITDLLQWRNRRGETRSIYPHEPVTGAASEASAVPDPLPGSVGGR
jgi:hypothetical protein